MTRKEFLSIFSFYINVIFEENSSKSAKRAITEISSTLASQCIFGSTIFMNNTYSAIEKISGKNCSWPWENFHHKKDTSIWKTREVTHLLLHFSNNTNVHYLFTSKAATERNHSFTSSIFYWPDFKGKQLIPPQETLLYSLTIGKEISCKSWL
mgnify:CR=1 FL=1